MTRPAFSLSDEQLARVMDAARSIPVKQRDNFLNTIATRLVIDTMPGQRLGSITNEQVTLAIDFALRQRGAA